MQTYNNFFSVEKGVFVKKYKPLNHRLESFRLALNLFFNRGGSLIVETGCQREANDWGAGCSTTIFAEVCDHFNKGQVVSVDNSQHRLSFCSNLLKDFSHVCKFHLSDSKEFLKNFELQIDLLYLDSYDWFPNEPMLSACQKHQLDEFLAAEDKLHEKSILLLDDVHLPNGGKSKKLEEILPSKEWKCIYKDHQSLWVKS